MFQIKLIKVTTREGFPDNGDNLLFQCQWSINQYLLITNLFNILGGFISDLVLHHYLSRLFLNIRSSETIWRTIKFLQGPFFLINNGSDAFIHSLDLDFQCHISWSFLHSTVWGKRWVFILLILVALLTITVKNFLS